MRKEARKAGRKRNRIQVNALRGSVGVNDRRHCQVWSVSPPASLCLATVTIFTGDRKLPSPSPSHHFLLLIRRWQAVCPGADSTQTEAQTLLMREKQTVKVCVCDMWSLWVWMCVEVKVRGATRSLMTSGSGFNSTFHLLWQSGQWASITGCCESCDWVLTCLWRVTHLPSWFLSMTSNCFLSHLQREGGERKHETERAIITRTKAQLKLKIEVTKVSKNSNTVETAYRDHGYSEQPLIWIKKLRQNLSDTNAV